MRSTPRAASATLARTWRWKTRCVFYSFGIVGGTTGDRVDALVWGFSQLFPSIIRPVQVEPTQVYGKPFRIGGRSNTQQGDRSM